MHETGRLRPHSPAAAAQLLELWVQGRARLGRMDVDDCLQILQDLDAQVADKYDAVYVNVSRETEE